MPATQSDEALLKARRPRGSVRPLLLDAAVRVFSERGYSGATTREIAEAAGTSEALIFRYFGSKANLFDAAVIEPFTEFITMFSQEWTARDRVETLKDPADEFVGGLYRSLRSNRQTVLAMLTAQHSDHDRKVDLGQARCREALERLTEYVVHVARENGWQGLDHALFTRLVVGMVVAAALFEDWIFADQPDDPRAPLDAALVDEMSAIILAGVARGPEPAPRATVTREPELSRIVVTGADSTAVLAAATDWIAGQVPPVEIADLGWQPPGPDGEPRLHLYFRAP